MNMRRIILTSVVSLSAVILMVGFWSYSQAAGDTISICVKKSGLVYVIGDGFRREDCRKNESLLTWSVQGIQGPKGDTGPMGPRGEIGPRGDQGPIGQAGDNTHILHLFDDNGQDLGIVIDKQTTYLPSLNVFVEFRILGSHAEIVDDISTLWFDGPNCTGQAFKSDEFHYQKVSGFSSGNGIRYFRMRKNDVAVSRTRQSRYTVTGCENIAELNLPSTYAFEEITLPFTEPLSIPLEFRIF